MANRVAIDIVLLGVDPFHVRRCVDAVDRHTEPGRFRLLLSGAEGDGETVQFFAALESTRGDVTTLPGPLGDVGAALAAALGVSDAGHLVVLDSASLVTPGWLPRLLAAVSTDPRVGLVSPVVQAAGATNGCPLGYSFVDLASLVATRTPRYPEPRELPDGCWLVTRAALDALRAAGNDPGRFRSGRALQAALSAAGWRTVVADDCLVYRTDAPEPSAFPSPTLELSQPLPDVDYDVVYYVPAETPALAGLPSIVELVNRLVLRGLRATVATTAPVWRADFWPLFSPLRYLDEYEFLAFAPRARVLVAASYRAVPAVAHLARAYGYVPVFFAYDYEGYLDNGAHLTDAAIAYGEIPTRIAGSSIVQGHLERQHGLDSVHVPLGVSVHEFSPRAAAPSELARLREGGQFLTLVVLYADDLSGVPYVFEAARRLIAEAPTVRLLVAGRREPWTGDDWPLVLPELPNLVGLGWLDRAALAGALAAVDAVVDPSLARGFSRVGLEALACATPAVLSRGSGAAEFGVDGENCLLFEPRDVRGLIAALLRLQAAPELGECLGAAGRATALRYDWDELAGRHLALLALLAESATVDGRWFLSYQAHRAANPIERGAPVARWWS